MAIAPKPILITPTTYAGVFGPNMATLIPPGPKPTDPVSVIPLNFVTPTDLAGGAAKFLVISIDGVQRAVLSLQP